MKNSNNNDSQQKKLGRPVGLKAPMRKLSTHFSDQALDYAEEEAKRKNVSVASELRNLVEIGLKTILDKKETT